MNDPIILSLLAFIGSLVSTAVLVGVAWGSTRSDVRSLIKDINSHEERIARLEANASESKALLATLNARVDGMTSSIDLLRRDVDMRFDKLDARFDRFERMLSGEITGSRRRE